ncbi:MAG: DUF2252 family protein [Verrucomicrobia bacterium]|nr:DUF2252 family protein [Verrucomicrobiota bacterium]
MRNIVESTLAYEEWLKRQIPLIPEDLEVKHRKMAHDKFQFLRATFYRWCELWPEIEKQYGFDTAVLAVGDLHVQNFGTWRDMEGRLVWGVNDFDEVATCSFANDLVRVAASAILAAKQNNLILLSPEEIFESLLSGYGKILKNGGRPYVLDRDHSWLRNLARAALKEPPQFWDIWFYKKTERVPDITAVPEEAQKLLVAGMPLGDQIEFRWKASASDPKGLGSLGHQRFFAVSEWRGGPIARELKAVSLSAWLWAQNLEHGQLLITDLIQQAVRSPDPFLKVIGNWLIRPVAADCGRIDLDLLDSSLPEPERHKDQIALLSAMGAETANVHLGSISVNKLSDSFGSLTIDKLHGAVHEALKRLSDDFDVWQKYCISNSAKKA